MSLNKEVITLSLPIGNLQDLTLRVKGALETGKFFVAEDTRMLKKILGLLGISYEDKLILSYHDHSAAEKIDSLLDKLHTYRLLYVVSDAGSPVVSDPAFPLIKRAIEREIKVSSFPGPSSLCMALELSGLPPIPFHFHGFFPRQTKAQEELLGRLATLEGSHMFFESPERILESLTFAAAFFPQLRFAVVKEMTKKFENVWRFQGSQFSFIKDSLVLMGEFVFLFHVPKEGQEKGFSREEAKRFCQEILQDGARPKVLSKLIAQVLGEDSKEIYQRLTQLNK